MKKETKIFILVIVITVSLVTVLDIQTKGKITSLIGSVNPMDLKSSDVPYTNNGQSTVQGAIDNLYTMASACPSSAFKLGDYFSLTPTNTSFEIIEATTSCSNNTINPSELTLWRVIDIHSDGSVDAVSEYVSSKTVCFKGTAGYANFVGGLQTIAAAYAKPGYTISTRIMGYGGQTPTIADRSLFNGTQTDFSVRGTSTPTSGTGEEFLNISPGDTGDTLFLKDYLLVKNVYGNVKANKVGTTTATAYWISSRKCWSSATSYFGGRFVNASGDLEYNYFRSFNHTNDSWDNNWDTRALRPIITLKSGVSVSGGRGTKASPYTLQ